MPPAPDPDAPQRSALLSGAVLPRHRLPSRCSTRRCHLRGAKLVDDPQAGTPSRPCPSSARRSPATGGVPTIAWQLIEHPARDKYDLSSLQSVSYGGAPSAPELVRQDQEGVPGSQPGNGWGMTETTPPHLPPGRDYENRPDSAGPPPRSAR
jgi:long-chain acyl-CoA synthetase